MTEPSGSATAELGSALAEEGLDRLGGVIGVEVHGLGHAFSLESGGEVSRSVEGEQSLGHGHGQRRAGSQTIGPLANDGVEFGVGDNLVDETETLGFLRGDDVGEEGQLLGLVQPDEAGQDPGTPKVDRQTAAAEDLAEPGLITGHDQIAGQGHVHPGPRRHAVDLGDDGNHDRVQGLDGHVDHVHALELVPFHTALTGQIGAAAEGVARSGHDHTADVGIEGDLRPGLAQFVPHGGVGRVLLLRPVHGDGDHAVVGDVDQERFEGLRFHDRHRSWRPATDKPESLGHTQQRAGNDVRATTAVTAVMMAAAVIAVDPWGFAPFGSLRMALLASTTFVAAAVVVWTRPSRSEAGRGGLADQTTMAWVAFGVVAVAATVLALDPLHAWIGTPDRRFGLLAWLMVAVWFVVGRRLASSRGQVARIASLSAVALGLYSGAEALGLAPVTLVLASGRLGGPFGQPAYLGAAAVLLGPVAIGLACAAGPWRGWRLVGVAGAVAAAGALVASGTLAALAGAVASLVALVVVRRRSLVVRGPLRWGLLTTAPIAAVIAVSPLGARLTTVFALDGPARSRWAEWSVAARVLADRPLLGTGPEGYRIAFQDHVDADYIRRYGREVITDRTHNGLLDVGVTTGVVGLVLFAVLLILVARAALAAIGGDDPVTMGIGAAVIGYVAQQQFLFPLAELDPVFWLLAGTLVAPVAVLGPTPALGRRTLPVKLAAATCAVAALAAAVAGSLDLAADHHLANAVGAAARADHLGAGIEADRATALRPDSTRNWFVAATVSAGGGTILAIDRALDRVEQGLRLSPADPALQTLRSQLLADRARRSGLPADVARVENP